MNDQNKLLIAGEKPKDDAPAFYTKNLMKIEEQKKQ